MFEQSNAIRDYIFPLASVIKRNGEIVVGMFVQNGIWHGTSIISSELHPSEDVAPQQHHKPL